MGSKVSSEPHGSVRRSNPLVSLRIKAAVLIARYFSSLTEDLKFQKVKVERGDFECNKLVRAIIACGTKIVAKV